MKSILHLKDDTEYQIPLREKDGKVTDRAKVDVATANSKVEVKKENKTDVKDQQNSETPEGEAKQVKAAEKKPNEISQEEVAATQSQDDVEATEVYEEDPDETQTQEQSNAEEGNSGTTTESVPPADTAKAALDKMKKLASQGGVIHPSLFISNFSKILGLMERAMQLQVKESGSATEESGSATEEKAPKATEQAETAEQTEAPKQTETPAEGK